jgi:hypothetical protein
MHEKYKTYSCTSANPVIRSAKRLQSDDLRVMIIHKYFDNLAFSRGGNSDTRFTLDGILTQRRPFLLCNKLENLTADAHSDSEFRKTLFPP